MVTALVLTATLAFPTPHNLTAAEVVDKAVAAQGGVVAWSAVKTLSLSGKMETAGAIVPFLIEEKRGRKVRLELEINGKKAVQMYDGVKGWKLGLGRSEPEPYTSDETQTESMRPDLGGPLIDYAAKGAKVEIAGTQQVEGRDAYILELTMKSGRVQRVWLDTQTFLVMKIEVPRCINGKLHTGEIYYRDYRSVDGLMIPYLAEIRVPNAKQTQKLRVESVIVNPELDNSRFAYGPSGDFASEEQLQPVDAPASQMSASVATQEAALVVVSNPGSAQVYINDEPRGTTSSEGRLVFKGISPGDYRIRVGRSNYKDFIQSVEVKPGSATSVEARLQPTGPPALTIQDIMDLLRGGVPSKRARALVEERGVDFVLDSDVEKKIRDAGGDAELLLAIARGKK